jgi:hypothetical protein
MLIGALVLVGVLVTSFTLRGDTSTEWKNAKEVTLDAPRPKKISDTFFSRLMKPQRDPDLKIERPKDPAKAVPAEGGS